MENLELEAERPELPQLETTTKKAKRKKRRSRKANPRPKQSLNPAVDSSTTSNSGSDPAAPIDPIAQQKFEAACEDVLGQAGTSSEGDGLGGDPELDEGAPNPEFEKMAKIYLSKPFKLMAFMLEDDEIKLTPEQLEILVPEGALSLEEAWPHLPEWFKNSRWKHTYAFVFSFGLVAGENCARIYKRIKALTEQQPMPDPHVNQHSISTAGSQASSDTLLRPVGAKLI